MSKEYYCSFEQAVKLKELGFKDKCNAYYWTEDKAFECTNSIVHKNSDTCQTVVMAPRLDQAQAWLREVKGWDVTSIPTLAEYGKKKYRWDICHWDNPEYGNCSNGIFDTYELALSAGIDAAIEILTNKQTDK